MKNKHIKLVGVFCMALIALSLNASSSLTFVVQNLGAKFLKPLEFVEMSSNSAVKVSDGAYAILKCNGTEIARARLSVIDDYDDTVIAWFDEELILPKGNQYNFIVPQGMIRKLDDNSCYNDQIEVNFEVPATLGSGTPSIKDGSVLSCSSSVNFSFDYAIGNNTTGITFFDALLFREGFFVRQLPSSAASDWNLGLAYVSFLGLDSNKSMIFEDGVHYSVVIPEGTISASERKDIVNEETRVSFIGGYKEPMPSLECTWISAFEEGLGENIGEVRFRFNMPVALSGDPKVQICLVRSGYPVVTETTPFLRDEDGRQTLVADFGGYPVSSIGDAFTFVIKEGSVVSADGDVVVNDRTESPSFSGIDAVSADSPDAVTVKADAGTVIVEGAHDGAPVRLYSADGRMLREATASGGFAAIAVRSGMYIVTVDGTARKVAVK